MNKAQKFLLKNNLDDIVLNEKQYPENTPENAKEWVYLSDVLEQYLEQNQALRIHDVVGRSEQLRHDENKKHYEKGWEDGASHVYENCIPKP